MIDIHCHILPGVDDGSESPDITREMAISALEHGTTHIICTPHCNSDDPDLPRRLQQLRQSVETTAAALAQYRIPLRLLPGMELFCGDRLEYALRQPDLLTLAGSRYLLLEFDFEEDLPFLLSAAEKAAGHGFLPVIAHPERYTALQRDPEAAIECFERGYLLQVNRGSILGDFGRKVQAAADAFLSQGIAHFVASDAHNDSFRRTPLADVYQYISQNYAPEYADILLNQNPMRVLQNRLPVEP